MKIHEIMSRDVSLVSPDTPIREAARRMRDENIGALPVGDDDRLTGMITDRDIVVRGVAGGELNKDSTVGGIMSGELLYCFDDDDVDRAAGVMAEHQVRRLPIVNRDKRLVGIVALADIGRSDGEIARTALGGISRPDG